MPSSSLAVVNCPGNPESPRHGNVTCNGNTYQSVCEFKCEMGYNLIGKQDTKCTEERSWDTESPNCQSTNVYHIGLPLKKIVLSFVRSLCFWCAVEFINISAYLWLGVRPSVGAIHISCSFIIEWCFQIVKVNSKQLFIVWISWLVCRFLAAYFVMNLPDINTESRQNTVKEIRCPAVQIDCFYRAHSNLLRCRGKIDMYESMSCLHAICRGVIWF